MTSEEYNSLSPDQKFQFDLAQKLITALDELRWEIRELSSALREEIKSE